MEASPQRDPSSPPDFQRPADHVFLAPEVVEVHLQNNVPVDAEKARLIWLMNHAMIDDNPETTQGGW